MESPVVLDKPPEYHGNERGFPFEDEEVSGAWSELAARHPDIAARLRQRPASASWARKRRPSSQDATDDYGENFGSFDRFPFDDIPPEFREHFPSHWNRGFGSREEAPPPPPPPAAPPAHSTAGTQTEGSDPGHEHAPLPQYGLRNTVDLGQRSPADPSVVDAEERSHRSMSAPPAARPPPPDMSSPPPAPAPGPAPGPGPGSNVRVIPIFVEGRDEPVVAPPPAPHVDRDHYFAEDAAPSFHHPPNFSRTFTTPSTKGFRQGPQPFMQQKAYPQAAFNRGASPQRPPAPEESYVKVPVHHEHAPPGKPAAPQHAPPQHAPPHAQQHAPPHAPQHAPPHAPPHDRTPPPAPPKPAANDPITQILSIQTDVLNLMNEVENFAGSKKDKRYLFLDEMLTRNLIKLDNIETEGKENIRQARREAIKCIQKCIAVLEAKAEKNGKPQAPDVDMAVVKNENAEAVPAPAENGEVEMKEEQPPAPEQVEPQATSEEVAPPTQDNPIPPVIDELPPSNDEQPQSDSTPSNPKPEVQPDQLPVEDKPSPKKKVVKKRDKSKDKAAADSVEAPKDSDKVENVEVMQVDNKGDKTEQVMEVDGAASQ